MKQRRFGMWCLGSMMAVAGLGATGCGGSDNSNGTFNAGRAATGATGGDNGSGGDGATGGSGGSRATGGSGGDSGTTGGSGGDSGTTGGSAGDNGSGGSTAARGGSTSTGGSSTGGTNTGSGGSGAAATDDLLDEIEGHCERSCDAQYALDCAPGTSNKLVCETSCVAQTAQLGDFCLREYADYVKCQADGGYACLQNTPYPNSTCAVQQLAFSQCAQHIGCKRECAVSIGLGCTESSQDECVETCIADTMTTDDQICAIYSEQIAYCRATQPNPSCNGEHLLTPTGCSTWVLEVGDCIHDETSDYCQGWCYAADSLGCGGEDCMADCAAKVADTTCGTAWNEVMDCGLFFGDAACTEDMGLMANGICDSEVQTYTMCLAGPATM